MAETEYAINILPCVRELYVLEAVTALKAVDPFKLGHERWEEDFAKYRNLYIKNLAQAIYDYTVLVCTGELRHAGAASEYHHPWIQGTMGRAGAYRAAKNYSPDILLQLAEYVFTNFNWRPGYGGQLWGRIAQAAVNRHKWPSIVFVDNCVDLSHNNSIYFDKYQSNIFFLAHSRSYRQFLTWKARVNPEALIRYGGASYRLDGLITRAVNLGILPEEARPPFSGGWEDASIASRWVLNYAPITWKNQYFPMILVRSKADTQKPCYLCRTKEGKWIPVDYFTYNAVSQGQSLEEALEVKRAKIQKQIEELKGGQKVVEELVKQEAAPTVEYKSNKAVEEWNKFFAALVNAK